MCVVVALGCLLYVIWDIQHGPVFFAQALPLRLMGATGALVWFVMSFLPVPHLVTVAGFFVVPFLSSSSFILSAMLPGAGTATAILPAVLYGLGCTGFFGLSLYVLVGALTMVAGLYLAALPWLDLAPIDQTNYLLALTIGYGFGLFVASVTNWQRRQSFLSQLDAERAQEAARSAARAKANFLAVMSHEIRTPMNGVLTMAELLGRTELDPEQASFVGTVQVSARSLLGVIDDILDFSKVEAGKLAVETVAFDLAELIDGVIDTVAARAEEKGIEFRLFVDPEVPERLLGDPHRLRQILINLLGNAAKFTEKGEIRLAVAYRSGELTFKVTDTGIGMSDDQIARLFQPFEQGEDSTARRFGGSGLGLSISKGLIDAMNGRIAVDSRPGVGTTFSIEIPAPRVDEGLASSSPARADAVALAGFRADEAAAIGHLLTVAGARLATGDDQAAMLLINGRLIEMPDRDALADRIARLPPRAVLALAAPRLQRTDALRRLREPAGGRPTKAIAAPATLRSVRALLSALAKGEFADEPAAAPVATSYAPPPADVAMNAGALVLVAEDNETNQFVISRLLDRMGFAHEIVADGLAALDRLQERRFGLLITDYHMPKMDGIGLARAIRVHESTHADLPRLPILALTADAMQGVEEECRSAGMDGCLRKPIDIGALLSLIERHLPQALPLRRPKAVESGRAAPTKVSRIDPSIFDTAPLRRVFPTLDREALDLLDDFTGRVDERVASLGRAADAADFAGMRALAHAGKGAAANVGAGELHKLFERIQRQVEKQDMVATQALLDALPHAASRFRLAVEHLRVEAGVK